MWCGGFSFAAASDLKCHYFNWRVLYACSAPSLTAMLIASGRASDGIAVGAGAGFVLLMSTFMKREEGSILKRIWDNGDIDLAAASAPVIAVFWASGNYAILSAGIGAVFVLVSSVVNVLAKSMPKIRQGCSAKKALSETPESFGDVFYWCAIGLAYLTTIFAVS